MRTAKIVLAGDDPGYADALERALLRAGYEVRRVADGIATLELLRTEPPDALILDLVPPRLNGDAIVSAIRQDPALQRLPIVILSAARGERGSGNGPAAEAQIPKGPVRTTAKELLAALAALGPKTVSRRPRGSPPSARPRRQVDDLLRVVAHYEAVLESLGQGLLEVDTRGKILLANAAAERLLGTERSGLLGANVLDRIPGARESLLPRMLQEMPGPAPSLQPRYLSTGEQRLKIQMVPLRGDAGGDGWVLLLQDLTLETTLDRRKADLLAYACHELRGALTPIWASLKELADRFQARDADEATQASLQRVKGEIHRLLAMIEDLRAVARNEAQLFDLPRSPVDLREIVKLVVCLQQAHAATNGVRIRLQMPPKLPLVLGNRDKLCQVLHNLLANAIRYSPSGGEIRVRVEERDSGLVTSVEDQGPGIPSSQQEHIFRTFHLGSGLHKDYGGLGLAISKGILESQQGRIWAEKAEPTGARLIFFLPTIPEG